VTTLEANILAYNDTYLLTASIAAAPEILQLFVAGGVLQRHTGSNAQAQQAP
jgi:hypothetical protein